MHFFLEFKTSTAIISIVHMFCKQFDSLQLYFLGFETKYRFFEQRLEINFLFFCFFRINAWSNGFDLLNTRQKIVLTGIKKFLTQHNILSSCQKARIFYLSLDSTQISKLYANVYKYPYAKWKNHNTCDIFLSFTITFLIVLSVTWLMVPSKRRKAEKFIYFFVVFLLVFRIKQVFFQSKIFKSHLEWH